MKVKRGLKAAGKALLIAIPSLVFLAVLLAAWLVRRSWPQESGTVEVRGLSAPVEVVRDGWGVPHLYARDERDLFFAQGFVHAQDRLWQMCFNREVGSGRLAALFGAAALPTDRYLRTLGLRRMAERDLALVSAQTRGFLEAYAAGVNAFLAANEGKLPVEFRILGVKPEPWTPLDSLTWTRMMGLNLSLNSPLELARARLVPKLGAERVRQLIPLYPQDGPVIVAPHPVGTAGAGSPLPPPPFAGLLPLVPGESWASNGWVVHGSRTSTGKPILANDTHLGLGMPSVWYEVGLHGGRYDNAGFSFPGLPFVIVGQNKRIAWGITNLNADVQDLYLEKLDDPGSPTAALFNGRWEKLSRIAESIPVKGGNPVPLEVLSTRHGPLIHAALPDWQGAPPMALAWAGAGGSRLADALAQLGLAGSWGEFRQALSLWDSPSLNFVYADVDGNIGYQATARTPIRAPGHDGLSPVPGWDGGFEWRGTIPFEEMPSSLNPPAGFIVTANHRVVGDEYPYPLTYDWPPPDRARRLSELLAEEPKLTLERARAIQLDTFSALARDLRPYLLATKPQGEVESAALDKIRAWNLRFDPDQAGASVFTAWVRALRPGIFEDEIGADLAKSVGSLVYGQTDMLTGLMARPRDPWFDDRRTPAVETRDAIVARAFSQAVSELAGAFGEDSDTWTWGRVQTAAFAHAPFGLSGVAPLERIFNGSPVPAPGWEGAVNLAGSDPARPYRVAFGVAQRFLANLADLGMSEAVNSTGQSSLVFHRHREDQVPLWSSGLYRPVLASREAVDKEAEATLVLTPEGDEK